jgi:hypothetical protein
MQEPSIRSNNKIFISLGVFIIFVVVIAGSTFWLRDKKDSDINKDILPIPTLDLTVAGEKSSGLFARLIGRNARGEEIHAFNAAQARTGFVALAGDTIVERHNLFTCDEDGLSASVAFGNLAQSEGTPENGGFRFWIYEYEGGEGQRQSEGVTGRALFSGRFWLSATERIISSQHLSLHTNNMKLINGKRYYVMTIADINISSVDSDNDSYNDGYESILGTSPNDADTDNDGVLDWEEEASGTDPLVADTDNDGLSDGMELGIGSVHADNTGIFIADSDVSTTTDPLIADTDGDGLSDGDEDADKDGNKDSNETNPNNFDTDGGGTSDGDEINVHNTNPLDSNDDIMEICSTTLDEDLDGLASCYDDDCDNYSGCNGFDNTIESYCNNLLDDDNGGGVDCADADCSLECVPICGDMLVTGNEECDDGKHCDDGNGEMKECTDADTSACGTGMSCELQILDGCNTSCMKEDGFSCANDSPDLDTVRSRCDLIQPFMFLLAPRPNYLQSFTDEFGYSFKRVTGDPGILATTVLQDIAYSDPPTTYTDKTYNWGEVYTSHRYTTESPWNSDGSLIMMTNVRLKNDGTQTSDLFVLDGTTHAILFRFSKLPGKLRWGQNPAIPNKMYAFKSNGADANGVINVMGVNPPVKYNSIPMHYPTDLAEKGDDNHGIGGKANVIFVNGKEYVALHGRNSNGDGLVYIMDLANGSKVAEYVLTDDDCGFTDPLECKHVKTNSLQFSANGKHIFVAYEEAAGRILDVDLNAGGITPHLFSAQECPIGASYCIDASPVEGFLTISRGHGTFALDETKAGTYLVGVVPTGAAGEVFSSWETLNPDKKIGSVYAINLDNNQFISLTDPVDEGRASHFSATNINNPGWVIITYNNEADLAARGTVGHDGSDKRYNSEVIAIDLANYTDPNSGIIRLANTRSFDTYGDGGYDREPHAVPSPDGIQIMFRTSWGGIDTVSSYIIDANLPRLGL